MNCLMDTFSSSALDAMAVISMNVKPIISLICNAYDVYLIDNSIKKRPLYGRKAFLLICFCCFFVFPSQIAFPVW